MAQKLQAEDFQPFERVKVADQTPNWMKGLGAGLMPEIKSIGETGNLPVLHDRSFARTSIAMKDTHEGAFKVLVDGVEFSRAQNDPRVQQIDRMKKRGLTMLKVDPKTKTLQLSAPVDGPEKTDVPGLKRDVASEEVTAPALSKHLSQKMESRGKELPQHLRGRMIALQKTLTAVHEARKNGKIKDGDALGAVADVSERAFLISESGKSDRQKMLEAREGKVDDFFAISAHSTRSASREMVKDDFSEGLVSGVMLRDQEKRLKGERGLRRGDDFGGTAKRLQRLGLIGQDDPRAKVSPELVQTLMTESKPVRQKFEERKLDDIFPDEGQLERSVKEKTKKKDEHYKADIKHARPPESVAPTTYQQVGLSGAYMAEEISRDNKNAHDDRDRIAKLKQGYEKAKTKENSHFAQAGFMEAGMMGGVKTGRDSAKVQMGLTTIAVRANTGVAEVSERARTLNLKTKPNQTRNPAGRVGIER